MTKKISTSAIRFPCDLRKLVLVTTHAHFDQLPICLKMKDILSYVGLPNLCNSKTLQIFTNYERATSR